MTYWGHVRERLRTCLSSLHRDESGAAAVEFAIFVPVIAFIALAAVDFSQLANQRQDVSTSLSAGIHYFMVGGEDPEGAVAAVETSWERPTERTAITADTACFCGEIECSCIKNCEDGSLPTRYHRIVATTTYDGILFDRVFVISDTIRVR